MPRLIAVVGLTGSGKSEACAILEKQNFFKIRFGDITMDVLQQKGMPVNEENERYVREDLRRQHGMAAYAVLNAAKIRSAINSGKDVVIDGLYSWEEYKTLKKEFPELRVLSVHASPTVRYQRLATRKERPLIEDEARSRDFSEIENIQKAGPISMADCTIVNEGPIDELRKQVKKFLGVHERHDWDEYFMNIAREVGTRGTCDRGRSGAIIVKNKRILTTGYVGSPAGLAHCDEVGHLMSDVYDENGKKSQHCIRATHAEQNALIQAARFGISLEGATIYCKMEPCDVCAKTIIDSGIKKVVGEKRYHASQLTRQMFQDAGIQMDIIHDEVEQYKNQ